MEDYCECEKYCCDFCNRGCTLYYKPKEYWCDTCNWCKIAVQLSNVAFILAGAVEVIIQSAALINGAPDGSLTALLIYILMIVIPITVWVVHPSTMCCLKMSREDYKKRHCYNVVSSLLIFFGVFILKMVFVLLWL